MKNFPSKRLVLAGLLCLGALISRAGEEQDLIAVLRSDADVIRKADACQRLRRVGTAECVPALWALLGEERLGHAARHALEELPFPAATLALREALGRTSGVARLGVIDSLGWRRDAESVAGLAPLLADADPAVASAAASALGRIGGEPAIGALFRARDTVATTVRPLVIDGLLAVAAGEGTKAASLYQVLAAPSEDENVRVAAHVGLIRSSGDDRLARIRSALESSDSAAQTAALSLAAAVNDPAATKAYIGMLERSPVVMQIGLLAVLQQRGDAAALPEVKAMAGSGEAAVRLAALMALGELGDATVVPLLAQAATAADPNEQMTARQSLSALHRGDVTGALFAGLADATPPARRELFRAMGARSDAAAVPGLLRLARGEDESLRPGAQQALGNLVDGRHLGLLVNWLATAKDGTEREDVRGVVESMVERAGPSASFDVTPVVEGMSAKDPETRVAMIRVGALFVDEKLRPSFQRALQDGPVSVQEAAKLALSQLNSGWLAAGPYREAGKPGEALFDVVFPPERPGAEGVAWTRVPGSRDAARVGQLDLGSFTGGDHSVVYARTRVYVPADRSVVFEIGSDDGIQLWVNGERVHSNNAVRGLTPGQDRAKGRMRQGWNDLLAKVTQHTAGCGLSLRIVGDDGVEIRGLRWDPEGSP